MNQVSALIEAMCAAVPAGRESLDERDISLLRPLTSALMAQMPEAEDEYRRFLSVRDRSLPVPLAEASWLQGKITNTKGTYTYPVQVTSKDGSVSDIYSWVVTSS